MVDVIKRRITGVSDDSTALALLPLSPRLTR